MIHGQVQSPNVYLRITRYMTTAKLHARLKRAANFRIFIVSSVHSPVAPSPPRLFARRHFLVDNASHMHFFFFFFFGVHSRLKSSTPCPAPTCRFALRAALVEIFLVGIARHRLPAPSLNPLSAQETTGRARGKEEKFSNGGHRGSLADSSPPAARETRTLEETPLGH